MQIRLRFPILALVLLSAVAVASASGEKVERFTRTMIEFVRATPHECSDELLEAAGGDELTCAHFGSGFSAWKAEWEAGMRLHSTPGKPRPGASWELRDGSYRKEFLVDGSGVVVTFDERTHEVVIAGEVAESDIELDAPRALAPPPEKEPEGPRLAGFDGVSTPVLLPDGRVEPIYPAEAFLARIEGSVILDVVIRADGTIADVQVLRGNPQDEGFEEAAVEAVRKWRYRPATYRGEAVDVTFTVYLEFTLPPADAAS